MSAILALALNVVAKIPAPLSSRTPVSNPISKKASTMSQADPKQASIFRAMPGYPWLPCPICKQEGYPNAIESCDHTVLERARVAHPSLVIHPQAKPQ